MKGPAALHRDRLRPVYTLAGDEVYLRDQFCSALAGLLPAETLGFSRFDADLATTPLDAILDQARSPSLMAPLQVFFVRNAKELFGRGEKKHGDFPANLQRFAADVGTPPAAVVVFIADHLHLPADERRISLEDKTRLQRIEATLGACGELVRCARVSESQAALIAAEMAAAVDAVIAPDAARALSERLEGNLGLMRTEIDKLALHAWPERRIGVEAVTQLVAGGAAASGFELAALIARGQRAASLEGLRRCWRDEGDNSAIGLVFQLSRAFKMALVARQERATDRSALYRVLPQGMRPPGFAADAILAVARAMSQPRLRLALRGLHTADVELRSSPHAAALVFERLIWNLTEK
ncbi:MAG TPA: DNA polymerase III subunit delta [Terriglobales bacterium]|nr:DNA polymerase III subunit delta [Terriglobales bacterium]